jgi:hypothetical protein
MGDTVRHTLPNIFESSVTINGTLNVTSGSPLTSSEVVLSSTDSYIRTDTSDAADSKRVMITGGGAVGSTRGATIDLRGNEYATNPGSLNLATGDSGSITLQTSNTTHFTMNTSGDVALASTTASTTNTSGALTTAGGLGVGGAAFVGGAIRTNDTTASSSTTTGSLIADGGLGVAGAVNTGGYISTSATNLLGSTSNTLAASTGSLNVNGDVVLYRAGTSRLIFNAGQSVGAPAFTSRSNGSRIILSPAISGSAVDMGFGVGTTAMWSAVPDSTYTFRWYHGTSNFMSLTNTGLSLSPNTSSTSNTTGSLVVTGGAGISGAIFAGGAIRSNSTQASTSVTTGSIIADGGVGIAGDLNVGGNTVITGNLTVNGTQTIVNTVTTEVADNIIVVNSAVGGISDGGFLVKRYQTENNAGTGEVTTGTASATFTLTAQTGATTTTVILPTGASAVTDFYKGWYIKVTSGNNNNQVRLITGYNGTTKTATINTAWNATQPAATDTLSLYATAYAGIVYDETNDRFINTYAAQDAPSGIIASQGFVSIATGGVTATGAISTSVGTASTSTTTGALIVTGGVGTSGALFAGGAIRTNATTVSSSVSTGSLIADGGLGVAGAAYIGGITNLTSGTTASSTTTGTLVVTGGVGVSGAAYIGGVLNATSSSAVLHTLVSGNTGSDVLAIRNTTASGYSSAIFQSSVDTATRGAIGWGNGTAGTAIYQNNMFLYSTTGIVLDGTSVTGSSTAKFAITNNTTLGATSNTLTSSTGSLTVNGDLHFYNATSSQIAFSSSLPVGAPTFTNRSTGTRMVLYPGVGASAADYAIGMGTTSMWSSVPDSSAFFRWYHGTSNFMTLSSTVLAISQGTASTSTTTGTLTVSGGVGMTGALFTGGAIRTNSTTASSSVSTGSLIADGGIGVAGAAYIGGITNLTSGTASTSTTTGTLVVTGGVGISGDANHGGYLTTTVTNLLGSSSNTLASTTGSLNVNGDLVLYRAGTSRIVFSAGQTAGVPTFTSRSNGVRLILSPSIGASTVDMGLGVDTAAMWSSVPDTTYSFKWYHGTSNFVTLTNTTLAVSHNTASSSNTTGSLTVGGGAGITGALFTGGAIRTNATTVSSSTTTGSLIADGGLGVAGAAYFGGIVNATSGTTASSTTTGALIVTGGVGISGDLYVGGTTNFSGGISYTAPILYTNSAPSASGDTGLLGLRYQTENNGATGDVVNGLATETYTLTSQSGSTSSTIILPVGASSTNSFYNGWYIKITSGSNINQVRLITAYNGTSKTATVNTAWLTTQPASADTIALYGTRYAGVIYDASANETAAVYSANTISSGDLTITGYSDYRVKTVNVTGQLNANSTFAGMHAIVNSFSGGDTLRVRNTNSNGYSSIVFQDDTAATTKASIGFGGSTLGNAFQSNMFLYSTGSITVQSDTNLFQGHSSTRFSVTNTTALTATSNTISSSTGGLTLNGDLHFYNTSNSQIVFASGLPAGAPAFTTRTTGTRIILSPTISASSADFAFGINTNVMWQSVPTTSDTFRWYHGTSNFVALTGTTFNVSHNTTSTSTTTGSLTVGGGAGITGALFTGGAIRTNSTTTSSSVTTGSLIADGGLGVAGTAYIGGVTNLTAATASTSNTTGTLVVTGGAGVSGAVFAGGAIRTNSTTASTSVTTGSLIADGGIGVAGAAFVGGSINATASTASSSTSTGSLIVTGGVGIGGATYIGGLLNVSSGASGVHLISNTSAASDTLAIRNTSASGFSDIVFQNDQNTTTRGTIGWGNSSAGGNYQGAMFISSSGDLIVDSTTNLFRGTSGTKFNVTNSTVLATGSNAVSATSGALAVGGDIHLYNGTTAQIIFNSAMTSAAPTFTNRSAGTRVVLSPGVGASAVDYAIGMGSTAMWFSVADTSANFRWYHGTSNFVTLTGTTFAVSHNTTSTSTTTGSLTIGGGVGITGAMFVGGAIRTNSTTVSSSVTTGSLIADGGLGVAGAAYIGGVTNLTSGTASTTNTTGTLVVTGGAGISGAVFTGGAIRTNDTTASSSTTTGSLIADGGLGVAGNTNVGGYITTSVTSILSSASNTLTATTGSLNVNGDVVLYRAGASRLVFSASQTTGAPAFTSRTNGARIILSPNISASSTDTGFGMGTDGMWAAVTDTSSIFRWYHGTSNFVSLTGTALIVGHNTASTSSSTGTLQVSGGAGISGALFVGGAIRTNSTTVSSSTTTGSLIADGGLGVAGASYFGGIMNATSATTSSSTTTGALVVTGGVGISGSAFIGGTLNATSSGAVVHTVVSANTGSDVFAIRNTTATGYSTAIFQNNVDTTTRGTLGWGNASAGTTAYQGNMFMYSSTDIILDGVNVKGGSSSIFAVQSRGLLGSGSNTVAATTGSLNVNGDITFYNSGVCRLVYSASMPTAAPAFTTRSNGARIILAPNVTASSTDTGFGMGTDGMWSAVTDTNAIFRWYHGTSNFVSLTGTALIVGHNTASTSSSTGTLQVSGGAGISGAMFVGGAIRTNSTTVSSSTTTGSLIADGGAGIAGSVFIGGSLNVTGAIVGQSTQTSFSASNNVVAAANVTGLSFASGIRSARVFLSASIVATSNSYTTYQITVIQKAASWAIDVVSYFDASQVVFTINSSGQIQYTSNNVAGFTSNTMKWRQIISTDV